jgi:DNA processing protein
VSLTDAERFARLRLARTDQIGPVTFRQLLERFGSAGRALEALPDLTRRGGTHGHAIPPVEDIAAEMEAGERIGARLIVLGDADYPDMLAAVDPPPPLLWALGDASLMARPCIAVVGARIASAGGQRIARGLSQQLGEAGHVVVSGLARGIDAAAHAGALPTGTVAVLGGGVDDVYPPDNADLYAQIVDRGCVVSESRIGARAQAKDFPRRNRIISGLSRGVIVVEAELKSGSLITARLAGEQGRDVFAVPARPPVTGAERIAAAGRHTVRGAGGRGASVQHPADPARAFTRQSLRRRARRRRGRSDRTGRGPSVPHPDTPRRAGPRAGTTDRDRGSGPAGAPSDGPRRALARRSGRDRITLNSSAD